MPTALDRGPVGDEDAVEVPGSDPAQRRADQLLGAGSIRSQSVHPIVSPPWGTLPVITSNAGDGGVGSRGGLGAATSGSAAADATRTPARNCAIQPVRTVRSPAFGGHPASIVPAAYSSVPKTGQNRRTSRPHLALRGTRRPLHVRVHARSKDLWDRHVVPSSPAPARRPRTTSGSASYRGRQRTVKTSRIGR